ncbi:MAG: hypothetical protein LZ162_06200 [Thaumarchaeota archaeon]|jgi:hypothetical protein|nr:hypothetical protein [Candidatus Terraquivivens yellowstonensis]
MRIRAEVVVEVNGREVFRGPSRSFVTNFAKALLGMFSAPDNVPLSTTGLFASATVTALDGSSQTIWTEWYSSPNRYADGVALAMNAPDNNDSFGIWVGSGSTPVSPTDYNLSSKIPHGSGSGQLDYEPHTVTSSYSSTSSYAEIARSFINRSGANVIVREVGIVARNYWRDEYNVQRDVKFLIARDVLPNPILVPNLASLTVRYRISLSL